MKRFRHRDFVNGDIAKTGDKLIYTNKIEKTGTDTQTKKAIRKQIFLYRYRIAEALANTFTLPQYQ